MASAPAAAAGAPAEPGLARIGRPTLGPSPPTTTRSPSTRKGIKPEDLNANGTAFGGSLLRWIAEEAAIYVMIQLGNERVVTKVISEISFVSSAQQGDVVEMGLRATAFGRTSRTDGGGVAGPVLHRAWTAGNVRMATSAALVLRVDDPESQQHKTQGETTT